MTNITQCPFCSTVTELYWPAVKVWKCSRCGLLFRNPLPSQKELTDLYEKSWSNPYEYTDETGGINPDLARIYTSKLAKSLGKKDFTGSKILDFGAGRGEMLTAFAKLGADVFGIEPFGYEYLEKRGFTAFRTLDELPKQLAFDGVVMEDVLEHIITPWNELKRLKEHLTGCGWIFISTPNASGFSAKAFRSKWPEAVKLGHLYFFTPSSLETLLANCAYARCRRLRWFIRYSKNPIHEFIHYSLQAFYLDGELKYLVHIS